MNQASIQIPAFISYCSPVQVEWQVLASTSAYELAWLEAKMFTKIHGFWLTDKTREYIL